MLVLAYIVVAIWLFLGLWKLHDLIFRVAFWRQKKADEALSLLARFFAEFSYKVMNNATEYEPAPEDVYKWLTINFQEWAAIYKKRKIKDKG